MILLLISVKCFLEITFYYKFWTSQNYSKLFLSFKINWSLYIYPRSTYLCTCLLTDLRPNNALQSHLKPGSGLVLWLPPCSQPWHWWTGPLNGRQSPPTHAHQALSSYKVLSLLLYIRFLKYCHLTNIPGLEAICLNSLILLKWNTIFQKIWLFHPTSIFNDQLSTFNVYIVWNYL